MAPVFPQADAQLLLLQRDGGAALLLEDECLEALPDRAQLELRTPASEAKAAELAQAARAAAEAEAEAAAAAAAAAAAEAEAKAAAEAEAEAAAAAAAERAARERKLTLLVESPLFADKRKCTMTARLPSPSHTHNAPH